MSLLSKYPEEGWVRIGPCHWRSPHGIVHEFVIGDREAIMKMAPEIADKLSLILNLQEVTMTALDNFNASMDAISAATEQNTKATVDLRNQVADAVALIQTETARLQAMSGDPNSELAAAAARINLLAAKLVTNAENATAASKSAGDAVASAKATLAGPTTADAPPPASSWEPSVAKKAGDRVVLSNGVIVRASSDGTTGATEPTGPSADGTVTWVADDANAKQGGGAQTSFTGGVGSGFRNVGTFPQGEARQASTSPAVREPAGGTQVPSSATDQTPPGTISGGPPFAGVPPVTGPQEPLPDAAAPVNQQDPNARGVRPFGETGEGGGQETPERDGGRTS